MGSDFIGTPYDPALNRKRTAWAAHYMRKGCGAPKARSLAWRKGLRSPWPTPNPGEEG